MFPTLISKGNRAPEASDQLQMHSRSLLHAFGRGFHKSGASSNLTADALLSVSKAPKCIFRGLESAFRSCFSFLLFLAPFAEAKSISPGLRPPEMHFPRPPDRIWPWFQQIWSSMPSLHLRTQPLINRSNQNLLFNAPIYSSVSFSGPFM